MLLQIYQDIKQDSKILVTIEYKFIYTISLFKNKRIGMRWRTKEEVLAGKGETICGNKTCSEYKNTSTYEVNFKYIEEDKNK